MANIIVSFWSENGKVFYEALARNLYQNGNNIFYLNMKDLIEFENWGREFRLNKKGKKLEKEIVNFSPDLVFSFNNVFPYEFVKKLSCPICLLDADTPDVGFWNKAALKQHKDRYVFLGFQKVSLSLYEKAFGKIKNYLYFPPATLVQKEKVKQDKNISFIGSNFLYLGHLFGTLNFIDDRDLFNEILQVYKKLDVRFYNDFKEVKKLLPSSCSDERAKKIFNFFEVGTVSGCERVSYLSVLSDLGLKLYGLKFWRYLLYHDIDLALCFDDTQIMSLEDNQKIYNSSKISVNISHMQAVSAFSWRVMDIMASNACLLMEDKSDWRELFEQYLSKETLDLVVYKDRFDMREKAKKLLADEKLRLRCVAELNNAIEQNGRWEKRYKLLEKFLGVIIVSPSNKKNSSYFIEPNVEADVVEANEKIVKKSLFKRLKIDKRIKIFIYAFITMLNQIPVIDLIFKKKYRKKLLGKLIEYWR